MNWFTDQNRCQKGTSHPMKRVALDRPESVKFCHELLHKQCQWHGKITMLKKNITHVLLKVKRTKGALLLSEGRQGKRVALPPVETGGLRRPNHQELQRPICRHPSPSIGVIGTEEPREEVMLREVRRPRKLRLALLSCLSLVTCLS